MFGSNYKTIKTKFSHQECRVVFPSYEMFNMAALVGSRLKAIASIPVEDDITLKKMAEVCGDEWPLPLLQWMYLVNDDRSNCIKEYKKIIEEVDAGEIEIGIREEAFKG